MALSIGQKAGWGLADMGINVFVVVKQLLVFAYLTTFLGVPPAVAGLVTSAVLAFDVVTDPLVGYLSDRTTSRWGRRAPWIAIGALVLAGGIIGIFAVPDGWTWQANAAWVIAFFGLATIGFTFVAIPYGAMASEMTQDPTERSAMMAFRMTFASLGLLTAGAVVPALAGDTRAGYFTAVVLVSPVVVLTIWAMLWFTRNAPRLTVPVTDSFGAILGIVARNRAFVVLVVLYGVMTMAVAIVAAGLNLAALYIIADEVKGPFSPLVAQLQIFSTLFAMFILGSILSQYVWVKASAALGKTSALVLGLVLYIAVLLVIWASLPANAVTLIAVLFLCAGFTNGAYQQIPWAMYPDLMDVTRAETGAPVDGAFSAVWLFGQKVANALAPAVLGFALARAGWVGSDSGVVDQTPEALEALKSALTLVPAAIFAAAILGLLVIYRPMARHVASHR